MSNGVEMGKESGEAVVTLIYVEMRRRNEKWLTLLTFKSFSVLQN